MSTGKERLNELLEAVITAQLFPVQRPLGQQQLKQLARVLGTISAGIDVRESFGIPPWKFHSRGRPNNEYFNTWLAAHFLVHKKSQRRGSDKALRANIAEAWATTPGHVKKLVTKHRKAAAALIERTGEFAVEKALRVACGIRSGAVSITPNSAKARSAAMLCVFHLADQIPKTD